MIIRTFVLLFYEYAMVENIVHVTADYEAQLARSGYVPAVTGAGGPGPNPWQ